MPGGDYREELRTRGGWTPEAGPVLDADGERVGEHGGAAGFTVGQRKGIGVALGAPRYVSRIDPATNAIVLGRREDLETTRIELEGGTFVADEPPGGRDADGAWAPFRAQVRIRHRAALVDATVRPASPDEPARGGRWTVETDTPVWAIAPGQACVLYDGDDVPRRRADRDAARGRPPTPADADRVAGARSRMTIPPALPLALLLGLLHTSIYVLIRGDAGGRLPLTYIAASLGAWAGAALGNRLGLDLIAIGDFPLIPASIMAWVGIGIVAILATLGPQRAKA